MGLDMDFYRLNKGTIINGYKDLFEYETFKYFRKNYTIHDIMCLSLELVKLNAKRITDVHGRVLYLGGCGEYKISKKQYEYIKKILKVKDLSRYIGDYNELDNPKQLLKILKDFNKYDFWYNWCN